jgi:hypothetical protein
MGAGRVLSDQKLESIGEGNSLLIARNEEDFF